MVFDTMFIRSSASVRLTSIIPEIIETIRDETLSASPSPPSLFLYLSKYTEKKKADSQNRELSSVTIMEMALSWKIVRHNFMPVRHS